MPERRRRAASGLALSLVLTLGAAGPAAAHAPIEGIEGFYAGLLHPLTTPEHLLVLAALALCGALAGSTALIALFAGVAAGVCAGAVAGFLLRPEDATLLPGLLVVALAAGAFTAAGWRAPVPVMALVGLAGGVLVGAGTVPDPGPPRDVAVTLTGGLIAAALAPLYVSGILKEIARRIDRPWTDIAVRALGAWTVAMAMLIGAFLLGPGASGAAQPSEAAQSQ